MPLVRHSFLLAAVLLSVTTASRVSDDAALSSRFDSTSGEEHEHVSQTPGRAGPLTGLDRGRGLGAPNLVESAYFLAGLPRLDLGLPAPRPAAYYRVDIDPIRSASTSLVLQAWFQLTSQEKVQVLTGTLASGDPAWLVVFVGEVAYAGIAYESNVRVADLIRANVQSLATPLPSLAVFLLDHLARTCPHDEVRESSRRDVEDLRARLRALGR